MATQDAIHGQGVNLESPQQGPPTERDESTATSAAVAVSTPARSPTEQEEAPGSPAEEGPPPTN